MIKKLKNIIIALVILLLAVVACVYIIDDISIATSSGGAATEDSKQNSLKAKDWSTKVDEEGRVIVKSVWADTLENILRSQGKDEQIMDDGTIYITCEDYMSIYSVFCSAHGVAMPSLSNTIVKSGGLETSVTDQGKKTAYLTEEDIDSATVFRNQTEWTEYTTAKPDNPFETTTSKTIGRFENKGIKKATPAEAWVLAEMDNNIPGGSGEVTVEITDQEIAVDESEITGTQEIDGEEYYVYGNPGEEKYLKKDGDTYYLVNVGYTSGGSGSTSYVQYAWWKVKRCGVVNNNVEDLDGGLAAEAEAFENYVLEAMEIIDPPLITAPPANSANPNQELGKIDADFLRNLPRNSDDSFKIDYKVSMTPDSSDDVIVRFNSETNKYIVGPYTVNYLRACTQQAERPKVSFSGIDDVILVGADIDGEEVLDEDGNSIYQLGENYRFVYQDEEAHKQKQEGFGDTDEDYPYPYSDEEFYIEMDYLEDVAYLKSLKFDFQYMTANGSFELFEGDYLLITWEPMTDVESKLVSGSGSGSGSASIINNTTSVALQTDISNRASAKIRKPVIQNEGNKKENKSTTKKSIDSTGEMQGSYSTIGNYFTNVGSSGYTILDGTTNWLGYNVIEASVDSVVRNGQKITLTGSVSDGFTFDLWFEAGNQDTTTHEISVSPSVSKTSFADKTFTIEIDAGSDPYVKKEYSVDLKWGAATIKFKITLDWYNSILNNSGTVEMSSTDSSVDLVGNNIYYEGVLDKNQVKVTYNPLKSGCEEYRNNTQYVLIPS